jgi:hypothetical protein
MLLISPYIGIGWDRLWSRRDHLLQGRPALERAREPDGLDGRVGDEVRPRLQAVDERDGAGRGAGFARDTLEQSEARRDVAGCDACALTTTGQPAASALAVSPPGTENASGKLLAPNTPTGPIGTSIRRRSGRGPIGVSPAWSIVASR